MPKVSVIMPAYNAEKYIGEAIDSILGQTYTDYEFIILNDCSKDNTEQIILSYTDKRIVYVKNEENMGVAKTLNKGLGIACGEYIARMDSDDISQPDRLEKQVHYLDSHSGTAVLGTWLERFGEDIPNQQRRFSEDPEQMKIDLLFSCGLAHPSVMMRRDVIATLGGYDMDYEGMEDYELWCRVAETHEVSVLPEVLFRYRVHRNQVTRNPSEKYVIRMRRLKERQLESLVLSTQGLSAESFYSYCLGKQPDNLLDSINLCEFLESVILANKQTCRYNPKLLKRTLQAVALNTASRLSFKDALMVCKASDLVNLPALTVRKFCSYLAKKEGS